MPVTLHTTTDALNTTSSSSLNPVSPGLMDDVGGGISCSLPISTDNTLDSNFLNQPTKSSKQWMKYTNKVNDKQRHVYKQNPKYKCSKSLAQYHLHPSPVRQCTFEAYHSNPSPARRRALQAYHLYPSLTRQCALNRYHSDPEPMKRWVLSTYFKDHDVNKAKKDIIQQQKA